MRDTARAPQPPTDPPTGHQMHALAQIDQKCQFWAKGAGSFHIHRKTMKELGALAVLGVREQPNLAQNLVTHRN